MTKPRQSFEERLKAGPVLCAEGYVFELERRGYVKAGAYVPEVVLEHPDVVRQLHTEFARTGSDVIVALTYYAHREKLKAIGRESDLADINRQALAIAKEVAEEYGALFAGNICNTWAYDLDDKAASEREVRRQYTEQVAWAKEAGVDFVLAETIEYLGEALIALDVISQSGLPAVINFAPIYEKSKDGYDWIEACKRVAEQGATVVGFNCTRGPQTILPLIRSLRKSVGIPIAAVPVPYQTSTAHPSFQFLIESDGTSAYTLGLDHFLCSRGDMASFAAEAQANDVAFIGICCGAGPHHVRAMAEALGRTTPSSVYSPDLSQHSLLGTKKYVKRSEKKFLKQWS